MNVKMIKGYMPKVHISKIAMDKMLQYVHQSNLEIGWLGSAERIDGEYHITDVFLFNQEVHEATTEITTEGLSEFAMDLMQSNDGIEIWNNMRVWGHSHVNMTTSPSSQDEKQMDLFTENDNDFFIRIIANKKEELRIDVWDYKTGIIYEQVNYDVKYEGELESKITNISIQIKALKNRLEKLLEPEQSLINEIKEDISNKVKRKIYETNQVNSNLYNPYYGYDKWENDTWGRENRRIEREKRTQKLFDSLSIEEIYELMQCIDAGGSSCDYTLEVDGKNLDLEESYELDELICAYVQQDQEGYYQYLQSIY